MAVQRPAGETGRPPGLPRLITTDPEDDRLGLDWLAYCAQTGLRRDHVGAAEMLRCTHYLLALELAKAGLGVALVPDFLAAEALASGTLVRLDLARLPSGRVYRLCHKEARNGDPIIHGFARWMRSQLGREAIGSLVMEARRA